MRYRVQRVSLSLPLGGVGVNNLAVRFLSLSLFLSFFLSWGHGGKPPGALARPGIRDEHRTCDPTPTSPFTRSPACAPCPLSTLASASVPVSLPAPGRGLVPTPSQKLPVPNPMTRSSSGLTQVRLLARSGSANPLYLSGTASSATPPKTLAYWPPELFPDQRTRPQKDSLTTSAVHTTTVSKLPLTHSLFLSVQHGRRGRNHAEPLPCALRPPKCGHAGLEASKPP